MKNKQTAFTHFKPSVKSFAAIILAFTLLAAMAIFPAAAAETSGDYTYIVLDDNTVEIRGYSGNDKNIIIPSTIDEKNVTSIGGYAFSNCTNISNVTIPDGVTKIDYYAFNGCTGLKNVGIPTTVTSISDGTFYGCTNLERISFSDNITSTCK